MGERMIKSESVAPRKEIEPDADPGDWVPDSYRYSPTGATETLWLVRESLRDSGIDFRGVNNRVAAINYG